MSWSQWTMVEMTNWQFWLSLGHHFELLPWRNLLLTIRFKRWIGLTDGFFPPQNNFECFLQHNLKLNWQPHLAVMCWQRTKIIRTPWDNHTYIVTAMPLVSQIHPGVCVWWLLLASVILFSNELKTMWQVNALKTCTCPSSAKKKTLPYYNKIQYETW